MAFPTTIPIPRRIGIAHACLHVPPPKKRRHPPVIDLSPAFLRAVELGEFRLPWWAIRVGAPGDTHAAYFGLPAPVRLVTVGADEKPAAQTFRASNQLFHRLMDCQQSGELVSGLSWRGCRLGFYGLYLLNSAIQRGLVKRFNRMRPGHSLTKFGFFDLFSWLEIRPFF